uniref:AlNc14C92G5723 protein n=1 Tax=Albugo laibachii Nc14 TaxID=890382 RepID=F0WGI9_9STRA|nr:AlNc14C92G5723 [Albugo laibachii Nc14]|eukprot:CCA20353.1 AlNc14C92G5723 [Albugo laibachii Nc14]
MQVSIVERLEVVEFAWSKLKMTEEWGHTVSSHCVQLKSYWIQCKGTFAAFMLSVYSLISKRSGYATADAFGVHRIKYA